MGQILHGSATTTEAIRRAIQNCADAPYERVFRRRSATPVPGFNLEGLACCHSPSAIRAPFWIQPPSAGRMTPLT